MRFTTLFLSCALLVTAARVHTSDVGSSSSSSPLLAARDIAPPSASLDRIIAIKREAIVEEIDIEALGVETADAPLEARTKKHKKHSHHHSTKPSHSDNHRSGHKNHSKKHHHSKPHHNHSHTKFSGKGTYFHPNKGSCGRHNTSADKIVALSADIYHHGAHCFKEVSICHGGKCVDAKVVDLCPGCDHTSLDMSPSLFKQLANPEQGIIDIQWSFT